MSQQIQSNQQPQQGQVQTNAQPQAQSQGQMQQTLQSAPAAPRVISLKDWASI